MVIEQLSPAKINLMLRILGQRSDGYHELQTCFKILPWGDVMRFEFNKSASNDLTISGFEGLATEDNLIFQAAALIKEFAENCCPVSIDVKKKTPTGGGLGGGSSNAATTLKILNECWQCHLTDDDLMSLGLRLGADVPVFIRGQDALAEGIGEQLQPLDFTVSHVLLLFPPVQVSTADIFNHPELFRSQKKVSVEEATESENWINDCLPLVLRLYPEIRRIHQELNEAFEIKLSGTGATLFALFDDEKTALDAREKARAVCPCHLISC